MANVFKRLVKGLLLKGEASDPSDNLEGSIWQNSASNRLKSYIQGAVREVVTNSQSQTLTNKTIDGDDNTISDLALSSLKTELADADKLIVRDGSGAVVSSSITTADLITETSTHTFSNKTIDGDVNTLSDISITSLKTELADANKFISRDGSGVVVDTKSVPTGDVVGTSDTQSLSGKTFTDNIKLEDPGAGTNKITIQAPTLSGDYTLTLPVDDGAVDQVLKTDGSGTLSWTTALTDPMTTIGDIIYRNGSNVTARLPIGSEGEVLKVASGVPSWETDLSGGGSGGSGDPLQNVTNAELSTDPEFEGNAQFNDDFEETEKSSFTNMTQSYSAARFSGANLTGNIKRDRVSSLPRTSVSGIATMNLQMVAPKATALSPSSNSSVVTFTFRGDVTSWFPDTKKVIIIRKYLDDEANSDGKTRHVPLLNASNKPAVLVIDDVPVYDENNDETTVDIANSGALDLDFTLSAADFPDKLRVVPFNYVIKANSANETPGGGDYEELSIDDIYGLDAVALQGEQFLSEITDVSINGRILIFQTMTSNNNQYRGFALLEDESSNIEKWRFFGQVGSNAPVYLGTKDFSVNAASQSEEISGDFFKTNRAQIAVSDDGKLIFVYNKNSAASFYEVWAVKADLTDVTPTITDIVTNGSGAGLVYNSGARDAWGVVAYDRTDLSSLYIPVRMSDNTMRIYHYTAGGTVYDSTSSVTSDISNIYNLTSGNRPPLDCFVSGTGTSHRLHLFYTHNTSFNVRGFYLNQGSTTVNNYNGGSDISSGGTTGNPAFVLAAIETATKGVVYYHSISTEYRQAYRYFDLTGGAPSISSEFLLNTPQSSGAIVNFFFGYSSSAYASSHRLLRQIALANPSDGNHVMFGMDYSGPDSIGRSVVYEVGDITAYQGIHISQYTATGTHNLGPGFGAGSQNGNALFQTFLMNANRFRTFSFRCYLSTSSLIGGTFTFEIQGVSAGQPNGTVFSGSTRTITIDASFTTSSSGRWHHITYDTLGLVNGTTYSVVLKGISWASGNLVVMTANGSNPYANGTAGASQNNGSTYTTATNDDWAFEINGEWVKEISEGYANHSGVAFSNVNTDCAETSLAKIDTNQVQALFRRLLAPSDTASEYTRCGIPYRLVATWGSGSNQSTWTDAENAAYDQFEPYKVLSLFYGSDESARYDLNTKARTTDSGYEDNSPFMHPISAGNFPSEAIDSDFYYGRCMNMNGTSNYFATTDSNAFDIYYNKPWAIRFEIKPDLITGGRRFIHNENTSGQGGIDLSIGQSLSGDMRIQIHNSAGTLIALALTNGGILSVATYKVVKVWCVGDGTAPKFATADNYEDLFNETGSYALSGIASSTAFASGNTSGITAVFNVGRYSTGADFYDGKLACIEFINGSYQFETMYPTPSHGVTNIQNGGTAVYGKRMIGQNVANSGYAEFVEMKQNSALVDSYPLVCTYSRTFTLSGKYMHLDIQTERPNTSDNSNIENYEFNFS